MPTHPPLLTVVMPCLNEEAAVGRAVESLADEYVRENGEILVVDGGSADRTAEIVRSLSEKYPVRLRHNPGKLQSIGLNIGIREARGRFLIRADAHCVYPPGYVRRCVEMLAREDVFNAGGVMYPVGETAVQRAIARAMRHPLGVGDAKFHIGRYTGYAEGAYLGAFKREVFDLVGPYDPKAHPNEDSELNIRIAKSGRKIWLDGSLKVLYFPRASFGKLFRQYFKYGRGRCYTTLKHRRFTSPRQILPPFFVLGLAAALALAPFFPVALAFPGAYGLAILGVAFLSRPGENGSRNQREKRSRSASRARERADGAFGPKSRLLLARAFATMHLAWGLGFLSRLAWNK
ncbi:MAG: glycosyltransferase family 2 protein [Candidatus Aminicenantes bacterium]|nr:glycosyltransferase family 2 protein [Candidatus Aminicenantes bacterium]